MTDCPLNERELEVLSLISTGLAWKTAARQLNIKTGAVEWIVREAKRKTGAKTVVGLVATALREGWME